MMSKYFNRYSHANRPNFNCVVRQSNASVTVVAGEMSSSGVLSSLSSDGSLVFSKTYSVSGETVSFIKALEADNGDFVIFGKKVKSTQEVVVLRVSTTGSLVWSKSIPQSGVSGCIDMIKLSGDVFVFLTEITSGSFTTFELVKISGSGIVQADYQATVEEFNFQPKGLEVSDSGFLVYGGTDINSYWDGFYIHFDSSLSVLSSETVGSEKYQLTRTALHIGANKFVVSGEDDSSRNTYIFEYSPGSSSYSPNIVDISVGTADEGVKRIQLLDASTDDYLLLVQNNSTSDAYLSIFDSSYSIQSRKTITRSDDYQTKDLYVHASGANRVRLSGKYGNSSDQGLVVSTNDSLSLCCISDTSLPSESSGEYVAKTIEIGGSSNARRESSLTVTVVSETLTKTEDCPNVEIDLSGDWMSQSPYLYLQAAGSDGVDGTVKGFHLRWDFKGVLGASHFPKGDLSGPNGTYSATHGFNKSDDFVKIYRSAFVEDYYTTLNLLSQPTSYNVGGQVREWNYTNLLPTNVSNAASMNIVVSFPNVSAYDTQAGSTPPASSTENFLKNYSGEINVRLDGKLAFRLDWTFGYQNAGNLSNAVCRHEILGLTDSTDDTSQELRLRRKFTQPDFSSSNHTVCEDLHTLRFDRVNAYPTTVKFYCYDDYILGINQNSGWASLDQFALTEDQTTAFARLEDTSNFDIDGMWPKFNDDDQSTGKFKVKVANYQDRWTRTDGLAMGVNKYLTLSQSSSNVQAIDSVPVTPVGQVIDNHEQKINYFNLLGIASLDYHVSRMLGMGHIDPNDTATGSDEYVYLAEYETEGDLEDGLGARSVKHIYMTPHQSIMDFKHSPVPELQDPITYGLALDNGTANPSSLTDSNGYTPFADSRFVNLNREAFQFEQPLQSFFQVSNSFSFTDAPQPVGFGIEYKEQGGSNSAPELSHDRFYKDAALIPETNLIPNTGNNPLFRHQETNEGIHCYQLYSVNWFSRTAGLSASVCTNETVFPVRNTMAPPANLSVHLVQSESPLMLTTSNEQLAYGALSGDKTYLRTMFDWNYIQNQAYQFADKAQFFFNKQEKYITKGEISGITQLSGHRLELTTASYVITSTTVPETVTPTIPQGMQDHFVESLIAINGLNYRVESIVNTSGSTGELPKIIIHQIKETNSIETVTGSNTWTTTESYVSPSVGDRFFISENLTTGSNWDNQLQKSVFLETFSTNDTFAISGSTNNDGSYNIESISFNGTNTLIEVAQDLNDLVNDGVIEVRFRFPSTGFNTANTGYLIEGDVTAYFATSGSVKVKGAIENDGNYTISGSSFNGTHTEVVLVESLPGTTSSVAYLYVEVDLNVVDYDATAKTVAISGDFTNLIIPTHKENILNTDGTETTKIMGGIFADCTVVEELDVYSSDDELNGYGTAGTAITNSRTGLYTITFNGNPLPPHIDPDVSWFRGKVRILENGTFLPTALNPRTDARMKELDVTNVGEVGGNLVLIANDPTFEISRNFSSGTPFAPVGEYVPIVTGTAQVNYHPTYLLYLTADLANDFKEEFILPELNKGSRQTFLGLRAVDSDKNNPVTNNLASRMSVPAAINAMEIREPEQPAEPSGAMYATRPDFYGKSTYTMDIGFPNNVTEPYSVLVYKANARKVLDQLYTPAKVEEILDDLGAFGFDSLFYDRWNNFVNLEGLLGNPQFPVFAGYQFPLPNNVEYIVPDSESTTSPFKPFLNSSINLGDDVTTVYTTTGGKTMTMFDVMKEVIQTAFVSQTREPMIFQHLQNEGSTSGQTSSAQATIRNLNGDRLKPTDAEYNAHPNAIRLDNGELRFTDYNIDGGAVDFYFYYALEMTDRQEKGEASDILGPIQVINTRPARKPSIKKVITQIENQAQSIPTAVCFQIEDYVKSENITRIDIYRALNSLDSMTTRTMEKAAEIDVTAGIAVSDICDIFSGLDYPLYGENLHYRLVALREVTLEDGVSTEFIPSEASDLVTATLVDPYNPPAPCISSENGTTTATELQNVILKWDQVCYNGTYALQKMNNSGNWVEIYKIKSNDDVMQYPPLSIGGTPDFANYDATAVLPREDENGTAIYHRFRIQVENSSGLFNLTECPRILATGDFDLQVLTSYLSYEDGNAFVLNSLSSQEVDDGTNNNPGTMTFTANIPSPLPAGHNSFSELEITVTDDQANTSTKVINMPTGSVQFQDSDGLLISDPNHTYTITTKLTTDLTTNGFRTKTVLSYVNGPCHDLSKITQVLTVTDSTHSYDLGTASVNVNNASTDAPVSLQFTDVSDLSNLPNPQTFVSMDIVVTDDLGNTESKQITVEGGSVTFDNSGPLVLNDGDTNRGFSVETALITSECSAGQQFSNAIRYTYDPYVELQEFTDVVSYSDLNAALINPLTSQSVDNDFSHPGGQITITDLLGANLPANHTFDEMEIVLSDGIGGTHSLIITQGASAVFNTGDGQTGSELNLGATNPNPTIYLEVRLKTDLCPNGAVFYYGLNYTYDPYVYLSNQTTIANFTDGNAFVVSPLYSLDVYENPLEFNDGSGGVPGTFTNPNGSITISDATSASLPGGDTFTSMEITITDGTGGERTKSITTPSGSAVFNDGDGGLALSGGNNGPIVNGHENKTYTISCTVFTTLCPEGVLFVYSGRYTAGL